MDSLTSQELEELKQLKLLAKEYGWEDDDPIYIRRKAGLIKKYQKLPGKQNVSTEQKGAEVLAPTIKSWKHVAVLITKDFDKAQKMIITHVPGNCWVPDKWSRGGKVACRDEVGGRIHAWSADNYWLILSGDCE